MWWSWILTAIGITGFFLTGNNVWWGWYVNVACQVPWFIYAIVTEQFGFVWAALFYAGVFGRNAYKSTRDHRRDVARIDGLIQNDLAYHHHAGVKPLIDFWPGLTRVSEEYDKEKDDDPTNG